MFPLQTRSELVFQFTRGEISGPSLILNKISAGLMGLRARHVRIVDDSLVFKGGLLRLVASTNVLVAISKGRVSVHLEPKKIRIVYELCFVELLLAAMIGGVFFGIAGVVGAGLRSSSGVILGGMMSLWFFMGNWLVVHARFRRFLAQCVNASGLDGRWHDK